MTICAAVSKQYLHVADRQTDRHTERERQREREILSNKQTSNFSVVLALSVVN